MGIRSLLTVVVALACIVLPSQVSARDRQVLEASSPWAMDYADDSCVLRRMFRKDPYWAQLELRRFSPDSGLVMTVTTNALRETPNFQYRFDAQEGWRDPGGVYTYVGKAFLRASFGATLAPHPAQHPTNGPILSGRDKFAGLDAQAAATTTEIAVTNSAFGRELVMQSGSLKAPWAAMQTCLDELSTHWGFDIEEQKGLRRPATPVSLAALRHVMADPPKKLANAEIVNFRFAIDETGSAAKCFMQLPHGAAGFEESSCDDLDSSLKFEPALDKEGKPIKDYWDAQINFGTPYVTFRLPGAGR